MTVTRITEAQNDGTSVTTNSVNPTSGVPHLACVVSMGGAAPTMSGTNGWNVTWSPIAGNSGGVIAFPGEATHRLQWFIGTPNSSTAGTITASGDGSTLSMGIHVFRINDAEDAPDTVRQSEENSTETVTVASVSLATFGSASNGCMMGVTWNGTQTRTATSPLTDLVSTNWFFGSWQFSTAYCVAEETSPEITWAVNNTYAAIALEIVAAAAGGGPDPRSDGKIIIRGTGA